MKKIILVLFSSLVASAAFAGFSIDWTSIPNFPANKGTAIARDASDNVFTTTSTGDIYLEKRDKFGNLLWQQHSFTTVVNNYEFPAQIHTDAAENVYVVGYRHTQSSSGHSANALIVLKYNPAGSLQFKLVIPGVYSLYNNSQYWTKVTSQIDGSGNIYIGTAGTVTGQAQGGFNVLKISSSGSIIRISTKNFPSGTGFHFVSQTRLVNDLIGVTGVTDYSSANATTWVLDTAGTDHWNAITAGIQGKDITFDNNGIAWMLTWISPSFSGDVSLYKFDSAGNQLWNKTYDFGGTDLAYRLEKCPDGSFAILAYGNQAPGGSYYVDWITFKTDTAGNLLWSDRYDEHGDNDEVPGMMAVDANNNIYVTGIGGPFPGGNILSARQIVTVKYSPAGVREWTSALDTINEYLTGAGMAIGSDNSVFVIGDVNSFIIHYLDHTGTSACSVPTGVVNVSVTDSTSTLSWNAVTNAYLYHVQYKPATAVIWEQVSTNLTTLTLTSLFPGTLYDYRVEAICNSGPTGYTSVQQFNTTGVGYCESEGLDASHEWIDLVYLQTILNSSPDSGSGYTDFTYLSTDLLTGSTYDITLSAETDAGITYTEFWKVWIDFNHDYDFTDAGEEVVSYSSNQVGWETHSFQVPANATPGPTKMRVSMKNNADPGPCEVFARGEVEDYTVNIASLVGIGENFSGSELNVYVHPESSVLSVRASGMKSSLYQLQVVDVLGKEVMKLAVQSLAGKVAAEVSMPVMPQGIYYVVLTSPDERLVQRFSGGF